MSELRSPFDGKPLRRQQAERLAGLLRVVADPARLILLHVLHRQGEPMSGVELVSALGYLSQPTISHHLSVLERAGLVAKEKQSIRMMHRLTPDAVGMLAGLFRQDGKR